jgi:hypothetical protein
MVQIHSPRPLFSRFNNLRCVLNFGFCFVFTQYGQHRRSWAEARNPGPPSQLVPNGMGHLLSVAGDVEMDARSRKSEAIRVRGLHLKIHDSIHRIALSTYTGSDGVRCVEP